MRASTVSLAFLCGIILCICLFVAASPVNADDKTENKAQPMFFSAESATKSDNDAKPEPTKVLVSEPVETPSWSNLDILRQDSGNNLSKMNFILYTPLSDFGLAGLLVGEVVKFTAPRKDWTLKAVRIIGWSGFNNTSQLFPPDRNFVIEVRDSKTDLLYKYADTQNMYFASSQGPVLATIEIPKTPVTQEFYVLVYNRGGMFIGMEPNNGTGNSYFVINNQLVPAQFKVGSQNETVTANWLIQAIGE